MNLAKEELVAGLNGVARIFSRNDTNQSIINAIEQLHVTVISKSTANTPAKNLCEEVLSESNVSSVKHNNSNIVIQEVKVKLSDDSVETFILNHTLNSAIALKKAVTEAVSEFQKKKESDMKKQKAIQEIKEQMKALNISKNDL